MRALRSSLLAVLLVLAAPVAAQPSRAPVRLDRIGDALPDGAVARLGTVRFRQPYVPSSLTFSPDGRWLVSDCAEEIWVWDAATGKLVRRIDPQEYSHGTKRALFLNDQTLVRSVEKSLRFWDVRTGTKTRSIPLPSEVDFLALSTDGGLLATGVTQPSKEAFRAWDARTGKQVGQFAPEGQTCVVMEWLAGTRTLAVCDVGRDGSAALRLWNVTTGQHQRIPLTTLEPNSTLNLCVAYSPDGKTVALARPAHDLLLLNVRTGQETGRLRNLPSEAVHLHFSPDGSTLAVTLENETVQLWSVAARKATVSFPGTIAGGAAIAFTPDGKTLAVAGLGADLRLWDTATGQEKFPTSAPALSSYPIAFIDGGKTLLAAGDHRLHGWNAVTGELAKSFSNHLIIGAGAVLSPDNATLALWDHERGLELHEFSALKKRANFSLQTKADKARFAPGAQPLAFSHDGKTLASGDIDGMITLYEANPWRKLRRFSAHTGASNPAKSSRKTIDTLAFAPDGNSLAAAGWTWGVRICDPLTGRLERDLFHADVNRVAYAPDGRTLVSASHGAAAVWEVATGRRRCTFPTGGEIAVAPDGRLLATVDEDVILWDLTTGAKLRPFRDPQRDMMGSALSVIFSPDSKQIAVGYRDASILIWDVESHRLPTPPVPPLTRQEAEGHWNDLLAHDAEQAYHALRKLVAAPQHSLPLLRQRLQPVPKSFGAKMTQFVTDLQSDSYTRRQKATTELRTAGGSALPFLLKSRKEATSLETCRRIDALLKQMPPPSNEWLRERRGVEILERMRSPEARAILQALADGFPAGEVTQDARATLSRLAR